MVCTSCYHKTIDVYKFILMCNKAQENMQHYLKHVEAIKTIKDERDVDVKVEEISILPTRIIVDGREFVDEIENEKISKFDELGMFISGREIKVEEIILEEGMEKEETINYEEITISDTKILTEDKRVNTDCDNLRGERFNAQVHDERMGLITCNDCHLVFSDKNELDDHRKEAKHTKEESFLFEVRHALFGTKYHLRSHDQRHISKDLRQTIRIDSEPLKDHETDLVCLECQEVFCNDKQLKMHMRRSHKKKHVSNDCWKVFPTPTSLDMHNRVHRGEKPCLTCLICKRGFASSSALTRHTPTHNEVKVKPHKCQQCDQQFTTAAILRRHMDIHNKVKAHKCEQCDRGFTRADCLREHMHTHNGLKGHKCEQCDKRFARAALLRSHMKYIHIGVKPHKCEQCDRRFTQASDLHTHMNRHKGAKAHKCEQCDRRFDLVGNLRIHMNLHNGVKPYKCERCDRRYTQARHLLRHMHIHNGIKAHKCEQCYRRFTMAEDLRMHMLIHSDVKAYKCVQCDGRFTHPSNLKRHMDTHKIVKAHKCEQCDRRFSRAGHLRSHIDSIHN